MIYRAAALLLMALVYPNAYSIDFDEAKQRCAPPLDGEPTVYSNDFKWGYEFDEMADRYNEIYNSGKRLSMRAFYDPAKDQFVFPGEAIGKLYTVVIPQDFIANIAIHLEEGLKRDYADYVFFPDIGHSHFFIPQKFYDEKSDPCLLATEPLAMS
jgi:hypothetical protein